MLRSYNKQPIEIGRLQRHAMDAFYDRGEALAAAPVTKKPAGGVHRRRAGVAGVRGGIAAARVRGDGLREPADGRAGSTPTGWPSTRSGPPMRARKWNWCGHWGWSSSWTRRSAERSAIEELERDFDAIFIGVGLGPTEPLRIPGENLAGVVDALRFIAEYKTGGGVRGGPARGVIGGGNTAIDAATAARRLGAEEVHLVYRREPRRRCRRSASNMSWRKARACYFHWLTQPVAVRGAGGGGEPGVPADGIGAAGRVGAAEAAAGGADEFRAAVRHGDRCASGRRG